MARRKRREKVYYNSDTDTWSNDSHEQPYLMPGTESYKAMQEVQEKQENKKKGDEFHEQLEIENESLREDQLSKSELLNEAYNVGNRKFRRRRSKERQNKKIEKIIEQGLGQDVDIKGGTSAAFNAPTAKSCNDELYNDSISEKDYKKEVIKDYKHDFEEIVHEDKDNDGNEDEWTPGMRKMARYM